MPWTSFDPIDVGLALRSLRKERRLTQAELAERAGLAYETISRIESGREPPSLRTAMALADALEEPLDHVVGRKPTDDGEPLVARSPARRRELLDQLVMSAEALPIDVLEELSRFLAGIAGRLARR